MAKLTFQKLDLSKQPVGNAIEVAYNPKEYTLTKGASFADISIPGLDSPIMQFVRGDAETLNLELFFDSTEQKGTGSEAESVTDTVDEFYRLVKIEGELHTPPIVRPTWGDHFPGMVNDGSNSTTPAFDCVVTSCSRRFTLFNPDGKPLRAIVTLALKEYKTLEEQLQALNLQSSDHTRIHVVQQGENLPLIAYEAYKDSAYWRLIAEHNGINDVRNLTPGMVLQLPPSI
jgi:nucleoid-associated protein YgaU